MNELKPKPIKYTYKHTPKGTQSQTGNKEKNQNLNNTRSIKP